MRKSWKVVCVTCVIIAILGNMYLHGTLCKSLVALYELFNEHQALVRRAKPTCICHLCSLSRFRLLWWNERGTTISISTRFKFIESQIRLWPCPPLLRRGRPSVGSRSHGTKLTHAGEHSGTSWTIQLVPVHLDLPLFWKSHFATCTMWADRAAKGLFEKRQFNCMVRPTVLANPSRKRKFSTTLFKPEEL